MFRYSLPAKVMLAVAVAAAVVLTPMLWAGPDAGQVSIGRSLFKGYCGSCHGPDAKGDGPIAEYLRVPPPDLTQIAERRDGEFPFELIQRIIDGREQARPHGSNDMPIWGDAFQKAESGGGEDLAEKRITALTHYLQSIQVATAKTP